MAFKFIHNLHKIVIRFYYSIDSLDGSSSSSERKDSFGDNLLGHGSRHAEAIKISEFLIECRCHPQGKRYIGPVKGQPLTYNCINNMAKD
jgi:hypothetical protein